MAEKMSLKSWINSKLKDKGITASQAKKNAGKYKSIAAAKKAGYKSAQDYANVKARTDGGLGT